MTAKPRKLFITHGEEEAALCLSGLIRDKIGYDTYVPGYEDNVALS